MPQIPRLASLDSTPALLREGYLFGSRRFEALGTDLFATRLVLRPALFCFGSEAASLFYDSDLLMRRGAMPPTALGLLQGRGSVQQLDGEPHRWRKQMFMGLMNTGSVRHLADLVSDEWRERMMEEWTAMDHVVLLPEFQLILCSAACRWVGLALGRRETERRASEFAAMIDGAGGVGPRNWRGQVLRRRSEHWLARLVEESRATRSAPEGSPFHRIIWHREQGGMLLDPDIAAVEIINLLRPVVAIAHYLVFAALALHHFPARAEQVRDGDATYTEWFGHEVRRFYPFMPFAAGRARQDFAWRGVRVRRGQLMVLDLYATNHDEREWHHPGSFRPDRFRGWDRDAFNFVPQGGGDFLTGHRCAGEWITIAIMNRLVSAIAREVTYEVPPQDLRVDLGRFPAVPASGFVVRRVRPAVGRRQPRQRSIV